MICIFRGIFVALTEKTTPVNENDIIVPFDTAPLHELEVLEFGERGIPERTVALIESYDLVFLTVEAGRHFITATRF